MTTISVELSNEILERLRDEAQRRNVPLETVINTAILHFLDDDEPTDEEILAGLRSSMAQVLAGDYRPAHEVLDEIDREASEDADDR